MREATGSSSWMNELDPDHDRIDEAVLALLLLGLHDRARVWKGHDWDALARLFQKGYITDPARRAKSVVLTDLGLREARRFFTTLFTQAPEPVKPAPAFDPTRFNFVLLEDFRLPPNIVVYEYKNHAAVDSRKDFLRLNLYLALDGAYATIWFGLLEPMFAAAALASADRPREYDFAGYSEDLFRGYIDSDEAAEHIFKALRVPGSVRYALPQVLSIDADNNLKCDFIDVAVQ